MVFVKWKYNAATTLATLEVTLTTSPTLSLGDPNATLDVTLTACIAAAAPDHQGEPVTFAVHRSAFEVFGDDEGGVDMFARGAFGTICGVDGDGRATGRKISLGFFRVNEIMKSDAVDLRERGLTFLTVPGDGTEARVTHRLGWQRIFRHEEKLSKADLRPGERFKMGVNDGYLGTSWWCFGDLEGDLAGKRFHQWTTDTFGEEKPDDEFVREGNWVLGRDPKFLHWTVHKDDERCIFQIVE